ncbi:toxin co-regulated pilus biosynthesis Q family protein (plasmid) [Yersinia frederiksenii Y225]|nr:toxin co-regulated pilus biosynthesis Q family protein [Yersinia frederiksenii Y225]
MRAKAIIAPLSILLLAACSGVQQQPYGSFNSHNVNGEVLTTTNDLSNIRFLGHGEYDSLVSYSGINSNLNFALKNIVPDNWTIKISDEIYKELLPKVSWDAGQQWLYVLDKVMRSSNLYAYVDWNKKRVDIAMRDKLSRPKSIASKPSALLVPKVSGPLAPKATAPLVPKATGPLVPKVAAPLVPKATGPLVPKAAVPLVPKSTGPLVPKAAVPLVPKSTGPLVSKPVNTIVAPVIPTITTAKAAPKALGQVVAIKAANIPVPMIKAPVQQHWSIERGTNLKDGVVSWAAKEPCNVAGAANWSVIWDTQIIYRVDAPLNFTGTFKDALNSLFILYGAADTPLYAGTKTSQCIVMVSDKEPL